MSIDTVEATITAENTFTAPVEVYNYFNISVDAPSGGTVTLQRRFMTGGAWGSWKDVCTYTAATEEIGFCPAGECVQYRIGVKTGQYGTASVAVRISQ